MKKSPARQNREGVTFYSPSQCYYGYNLINLMDSKTVRLLNMQGKEIRKWETDYFPGTEGKLISNGNLLYAGRDEDGPLSDLEGAGGVLQELSPENELKWEYKDPYLHHRFQRLENGNTLVLKWVEVPSEIASKVKGGYNKDGADGKMWGDAVQEINKDGEVVWEWNAHEHLDPEKNAICPLCSRNEWTHATCVEQFGEEKILVNLMRIHTIIIIDKKSGDIEWEWGPGQVSHQNYATVLPDENLLVLDNGRHIIGEALAYSRSLIVNPDNDEIVGGFEEDPPNYFQSSFLGNLQLLPNGCTLLVEGVHGRLMELDYRNGMVWEYVNPVWNESDEVWGENNFVTSAYRYGLDDEGLRNCLGMEGTWRNWLEVAGADKKKPAKKESSDSAADAIRSRLENLGY